MGADAHEATPRRCGIPGLVCPNNHIRLRILLSRE